MVGLVGSGLPARLGPLNPCSGGAIDPVRSIGSHPTDDGRASNPPLSLMGESGVATDWDGLAVRIRMGDVAAFNALYMALFEPLVEFAYQYVHDIAMAEDIVQDVFQSYWIARTEREVRGLRIYMYSAVKKRLLNQRRHARVVQLSVVRSDVGAPLGHSETVRGPDEIADSNDLREVFNRVLAELPESRRRVVLLRWKHQMSYPEIAQLMHISVSAAQAQVSRVQRAIRPLLKRFLETD